MKCYAAYAVPQVLRVLQNVHSNLVFLKFEKFQRFI